MAELTVHSRNLCTMRIDESIVVVAICDGNEKVAPWNIATSLMNDKCDSYSSGVAYLESDIKTNNFHSKIRSAMDRSDILNGYEYFQVATLKKGRFLGLKAVGVANTTTQRKQACDYALAVAAVCEKAKQDADVNTWLKENGLELLTTVPRLTPGRRFRADSCSEMGTKQTRQKEERKLVLARFDTPADDVRQPLPSTPPADLRDRDQDRSRSRHPQSYVPGKWKQGMWFKIKCPTHRVWTQPPVRLGGRLIKKDELAIDLTPYKHEHEIVELCEGWAPNLNAERNWRFWVSARVIFPEAIHAQNYFHAETWVNLECHTLLYRPKIWCFSVSTPVANSSLLASKPTREEWHEKKRRKISNNQEQLKQEANQDQRHINGHPKCTNGTDCRGTAGSRLVLHHADERGQHSVHEGTLYCEACWNIVGKWYKDSPKYEFVDSCDEH